jgi:hypothetical protein
MQEPEKAAQNVMDIGKEIKAVKRVAEVNGKADGAGQWPHV